jgi:hypothetical protein
LLVADIPFVKIDISQKSQQSQFSNYLGCSPQYDRTTVFYKAVLWPFHNLDLYWRKAVYQQDKYKRQLKNKQISKTDLFIRCNFFKIQTTPSMATSFITVFGKLIPSAGFDGINLCTTA